MWDCVCSESTRPRLGTKDFGDEQNKMLFIFDIGRREKKKMGCDGYTADLALCPSLRFTPARIGGCRPSIAARRGRRIGACWQKRPPPLSLTSIRSRARTRAQPYSTMHLLLRYTLVCVCVYTLGRGCRRQVRRDGGVLLPFSHSVLFIEFYRLVGKRGWTHALGNKANVCAPLFTCITRSTPVL